MFKVVRWYDVDAITYDPLRTRGDIITLLPQWSLVAYLPLTLYQIRRAHRVIVDVSLTTLLPVRVYLIKLSKSVIYKPK